MNTLQMEQRELACYLLTGPDSAAALASAGLPIPDAVMTAQERPGALVSRTGRDEYMAMLNVGHQAPQGEWCFRRHDCVFELRDGDWVELMTHLCQYDFHQLQPGDWLMASVAGINSWLYHEIESGSLLIGIDPGFSHYLTDIFSAVLDDLSATRKTTGGAS
ncbi:MULTISPECIES: hypothetical protein [Marinobacter]|jgi:sarcosine oxidase subunit gamma|uniref:hypothetical protein n=1 Tax=Marinobacter TaxID=2742 RepID=UPI000C5A794A|nr:hypothetical protein [Marinobacter nauticus]MAH31139.1 hypothetical protein [Marinobacter sp.]HCP19898.1 hypothetical protein [Marinobacter nauticus]|tara:strand:- start:1450 stop:1935 length:486 start_codon:yes stop_codon:yes gene_type:complete